MGKTVDEAMVNAEDALRDYVIETEKDGDPISPPSDLERVEIQPGQRLVSIPLRRVAEMGG